MESQNTDNLQKSIEDLTIVKKGSKKDKSLEEKADQIATHIKEMLKILNPNADEEIMSKTPLRHAKAMLELTKGYREHPSDIVSQALFPADGYDDLIVVKSLSFSSMCEHHLLPFFGECVIGYYPDGKILGLSKFPRLVNSLSKKMHVQERLTKEIADNLDKFLKPKGIAVLIKAQHSCMCFRGVNSFQAMTESVYSTGIFKTDYSNLDKFLKMAK